MLSCDFELLYFIVRILYLLKSVKKQIACALSLPVPNLDILIKFSISFNMFIIRTASLVTLNHREQHDIFIKKLIILFIIIIKMV